MNWQQQVKEFRREMKVEASVIEAQPIRFGFFGSSGGGKSVTAGIFAVGITPKGFIGWVDGEGKRSAWAIDIVCGMAAKQYGGTTAEWKERFKVIHIDPPYNPLRVIAATEVLEDMGCKTIIEDVMSQAWDSDGGYLDLKDSEIDRMAGDNIEKRDRSASSAAAHVKPWTHGKLVNKITHSKTNLVLLFQAKQKYNAKTYKPDEFQSPIQESGLSRTALAVGRVQQNELGEGGFCYFQLPLHQGTKYTHRSILAALPKNGEQFKFEHAEAVLKLCGGDPVGRVPSPKPAGQPESGPSHPAASSTPPAKGPVVASEKTRAWMFEQLKSIEYQRILAYAIDVAILMPNETLDDWPLNKVPTSKEALMALRADIEAHV